MIRPVLLAAAASAAFIYSTPTLAQQATAYDFDIPAGSLGQVLRRIVAGTGGRISFQDIPAERTATDGLRGRYTLSEALERVLSPLGYRVVASGNNEIRISKVDGNASEIMVVAPRVPFKKSDSMLLTRTDTPYRQLPATVGSVTEEVLRSRNTTSIQDALRNIPGVVFNQNGASQQAIIRGDTTAGASFTNGLRNSTLGGIEPVIDVEAIEVLKGPASILSGVDVPGGIINYVPKRALGTSPTLIDIGIGSGNEVRASVDTGGAISAEDRLYWRFVGLSQYAGHRPNGSDGPHSYVASGIFGYRNNGWKADATLKYSDTRIAPADIVYFVPSTSAFVRARTLNPKRFGQTKSVTGTYNIERDLISNAGLTLRLRNRGLYQNSELATQTQGMFPFYLQNNYQLTATSSRARARQFSNFVDLYAKFDTGPLQHQVIVAFDYAGQRSRTINGPSVPRVRLPTTMPSALPILPDLANVRVGGSLGDTDQYGAVIQDQINWGRLHLLGALRKTWFDGRNTGFSSGRPSVQVSKADKLVPNAGIVYDITKFASVYASYQKSFTPARPTSRQVDGTLLPSTLRTQYEAGVKTSFFNDRFSVTGAYFEYETSNTALTDPANPSFFIPGPGAKAHGLDFSAQGEIVQTLRLTAGLTWTHARDTAGKRLTGQSDYVGNLWLQKDFKLAGGDVIGIGAGGEYQSKPTIATLNFDTLGFLPREYVSLSGALSYATGRTRLNLTVDNIADRENYNSPGFSWFLPLAQPRTFRLVLTQQF